MGGIEYVYWPGTTTRLTPWMLYCLQRLDVDLQRLFGVRLALDSSGTQRGIRTYQEQVDLFLSRYRVQASGSGPFGDVRAWQGRRYVRHSGLGTVAQPGSSNHEIQGTSAAIDLADSGGPGIGTMGSVRSNWLRANAGDYGLIPEGFSFKEAWHYKIPNIFNAVPGAPAGADGSNGPEEDEVGKPFFDKGNRILWPNGYYSSYPQVIYNALHYYFISHPGEQQPGTGDTVAREVWAANDFMLRREADASAAATVAALKASGIPVEAEVDTAEIARLVVEGMPKPPSKFIVTEAE